MLHVLGTALRVLRLLFMCRWQPVFAESLTGCSAAAAVLAQGFGVVHPDRTLRRNRRPALKALLLPATEKKPARGAAGRRDE